MSITGKSRSVLRFAMAAGLGTVLCSSAAASDPPILSLRGELCVGDDATGDSDGDLVCDDVDTCPGFDDSADCNGNLIADGCDIAAGTSEDCNANAVPDDCDIAEGTSEDCNANNAPDECDVALGTSQDCNGNAVPDECDIAEGESCAGAVAVAFFFDAIYVDEFREPLLLQNALVRREHTVTTFSGTSGSSWSAALAALAAAEVLVIPELDGPDLYAALDPAARTAIQDFVNAGGGYVQAYCDGFADLPLLNDLFGTSFTTCDGFGGPLSKDPLAAAGTCFEGGTRGRWPGLPHRRPGGSPARPHSRRAAGRSR